MIKALLRYLLAPISMGLAGSAGVFILAAISPANPLAQSVARWPFVSPQTRAALMAAYHQHGWFGAWLNWLYAAIVKADPGYSRLLHLPVIEVIGTRGLNTLAATLIACILTMLICVCLCLPLARYPQLSKSPLTAAITAIWLAVPAFVVAIIIVLVGANWLPNPATSAPIVTAPWVGASIALAWCAPLFASARIAANEVWSTKWAQALIGRGTHSITLTMRILPHLLRPMGAYALLLLPQVLVGEAAVEVVFGYPGLGNTLVKAAANADLPLLACLTGLAATLTTFITLIYQRTQAWRA